MVSVALMVEKIFTKNCSGVHYFLTDFSTSIFEEACNKNSRIRTSHVTYGKGLIINMLNWSVEPICPILLYERIKLGRIVQLLVLNPVKLIFFVKLHVSFCTHAPKKFEINCKPARCST